MNILITGHRGFIGSRLKQRLEHLGHQIQGIDIKDGWDRDSMHNSQDILTCELPENIDLVIHLAGIGGVRESMADPKRYWYNNVEGTKRILEHYKDIRVLVAGSSSQYEPHLNPYAASKCVIESIPHPNVCFMRFHTVYNESARSGMFFDKLFNDTLEYVTSHERDFIHLEDLCDGIELIIANDVRGPIDIGTGQTVRISDIRPDLPIKLHTPGERTKTQADTTLMKSLGHKPKYTVENFLTNNNKGNIINLFNGETKE